MHPYRLLLMSSLAIYFAAPAIAQNKITVGPNVQVSAKNAQHAHWEIRMGADPENASHLVACSFIHSSAQNTMHTVVYTSTDEGKSWIPTLESDRSAYVGDPDCIFGLNGAAYFSTLPLHYESNAEAETFVYRSLDGGLKWEPPVILPFIDREYLAVDRSSGKYRGRIYLQGNNVHQPTVDGGSKLVLNFFRSFDSGVTFEPPKPILSDASHMPFGNGNAEVLSDGTYVASFGEWNDPATTESVPPGKPVGSIKVIRSVDGGETFLKADVVAPWYDCRGEEVGTIPMIAADHSDGPFKDRIYAVWSDKQFGHCDIHFAYSIDHGKTWSPPRIVNDEPNRNAAERGNHNLPVVAVNNKGVVGVQWYDRRDSPDGIGWRERFAASLDGGETFLPSVWASEASQSHRPGEPLSVSAYGSGGGAHRSSQKGKTLITEISPQQWGAGDMHAGDTSGMAADANGVFHALWIDNRTGVLQLWTTAIIVNGRGIRNGAEDLADLSDVTEKMALDYTNISYDPKTGLVRFDATLTNTSSVPVHGPIKLRVIDLGAGSGVVEALNADNHERGSGAVWDFSNVVKGGALQPGDRTANKSLEFHLDDVHPFQRRSNGSYPWPLDLIRLESKVLARE